MGVSLVARGVRALSEHINGYYRVLKGVDPDSVYLRLLPSGSFEVRHSSTNAAVFKVTDVGVQGVIQGGDIVDNTISSAEIKDDTIMNADVNSAAGILVSKLSPGAVPNRVVGTSDAASTALLQVTSAMIADGTIVDADIAAAGTANIAINKLAHVGTNNVLKGGQAGTANVAGQVVNADIAPAGTANIAINKLADVGAGNVLRSSGAGNVAGQVASGDIADQAIMDADINNAAAIGLGKLVHVGANNVLRSNGANNVAGQVVNADIAAAGTANIAPGKLAAVASGQILKDVGSGVVGGGLLVDANVAAGGTANVAINKLADVGANNVLRSSGAGNVAGKIVNADIAPLTITDAAIAAAANINGSKLLDASITASKLGAGITAPAVALIAAQSLASPGLNITFSGISGAYKHLELRISGRSTVAGTSDLTYLQFNGDATAAYMGQAMSANGGAFTAGESVAGTSAFIGFVPGATASASMFAVMTIAIPSYTDPTYAFKSLTCVSYFAINGAGNNVWLRLNGSTWYGTLAPVTQILVKPTTGSWAAGTVASLYGYT